MTGGEHCQSEAATLPSAHVQPLVRLIVVSGLGDQELVLLDGVDKPVLVGDASGPKAGQIVLQRLRLAQTFKRVMLNVVDQSHNPLGNLPIMRHPVGEVLPAPVRKSCVIYSRLLRLPLSSFSNSRIAAKCAS